jgi:lipid-A-disaccharide synthase
MKFFIIAGEQSGDLHGSNLVKELLKQDDKAEIFCWGGDLMEKAGATLLMHYKKSAFMGFSIILKNITTIRKNFELCEKDIDRIKPDRIILIDYAGFNLRIAKFAKNRGYTVYYYISPKFWAWNEQRVRKVKKYVDRMFIIFPFEEQFYKKWDIPVNYYGNPLSDEIEKRLKEISSPKNIRKELALEDKPVIAILAGSRRHEVEDILPAMLKAVSHFPEHQIILAGVKNLPDDLYIKIIGDQPVKVIKEKTYEILSIADAALVTSGTATLETALIGTPQVVCYKTDLISLLIGWIVIKVKYISLVNLIAEREVVRELIGFDANEKNIRLELESIIKGGEKRISILEGYRNIKERLGNAGASERIAAEIVKSIT